MKDFNEFSKLLLNGQQVADETNKMYTFVWRGYKACVSSQQPKFNAHEVNRRFQLAMKCIGESKRQGIRDDEGFKKPLAACNLSDELTQIPETQIPETQFDMDGKYIFYCWF